ncbi:MAG TPA: hypothetical protein DCY35_02610 [Prolixibacteraceae bacterium]|nr:hypothetical protein [Prolixibacteraceae bacterium]
MNAMKKFGLFLMIILFATVVVSAQPGGRQGTPEDMAKRQTEQMGEYVKMPQDLQKKVYDLNLKYAKKSAEMFQGGGNFRDMSDADRQKMREKREAMNKEKDTEMKKILSADQFKAYEKYQEEARQRMMQRR